MYNFCERHQTSRREPAGLGVKPAPPYSATAQTTSHELCLPQGKETLLSGKS